MNVIELLDEMKDHTDAFFGLNIASRSRKREYTKARSFFCKYIKTYHPFYTLSAIGVKLSGRDHTTVINAVVMFEKDFDTIKKFRQEYDLYITHMSMYTELGLNTPNRVKTKNVLNELKHSGYLDFFMDIPRDVHKPMTSVLVDCLIEYAQIKGYEAPQE